jgi:alkyl hydroperoxide reductase subunit AhpC
MDIEKVTGSKVYFPIVADSDREIATKYGMIDNKDVKGLPMTVRSVFFIDEKNIVRLIMVFPCLTYIDVPGRGWTKF